MRNKQIKMAAFGASVTEQSNGGGYVDFLNEKFTNGVERFAYGGDHISTSGVCNIDDVLTHSPTHCIIDWFSTGYNIINQDTLNCLETITYKFSKAKCKLIFLFLPRIDHDERIEFYEFVRDFLNKNNLYYIDLNENIKHSDKICRDSVHTTPFGAELYASIIYEKFLENESSISINQEKYENIINVKKLEINATVQEYIKFEGEVKNIVLEYESNKHSGRIELCGSRVLLWKPWSYYERIQKCNLRWIGSCGKTYKIKVLQDNDFDTSECKEDLDFREFKKELKISNIYFEGKNLKCLEIK